ncbi:glycosyltransferase family 4 protein [Pseudalkalibacillus decolorationis]|uniref:glycosyltransferase family 4 protein n=1 Tax=Pseudalkalibacillus decolorationis TaxID=163879 RepID=UPI00214823F7|nr:MraY family glycosyltransferase [Pseudalkalibacillus decolorationis]
MDKNMIFALIASFITVLIITPFIIKFAIKIGATDNPNTRKVHEKVMPRLGGLAIFIGCATGYFAGGLYDEQLTGILIGAALIIGLGIMDDVLELSAIMKLLGQIIAAGVVVATDLKIDFISVPFFVERYDLGIWAYPVTILWIVAITNAINLIDGLDGLAAGISVIGIATIAFMAGMAGKELILTLALILIGSTIGFLFYNFHPAKIFMGDTGALFLGYAISILSLLGLYKSVTLFSFIVPILILGVPIFDTTFAIIRRIINKKPISAPDKSHLHHRILAIGLSHRNTVLVIYALGILFSISAVVVSETTLIGSLFILFGLLVAFQLIAEMVGLVNDKYKPFLNFYRKVTGRQ